MNIASVTCGQDPGRSDRATPCRFIGVKGQEFGIEHVDKVCTAHCTPGCPDLSRSTILAANIRMLSAARFMSSFECSIDILLYSVKFIAILMCIIAYTPIY